MGRLRRKQINRLFWVAAFIGLLLDQITKHWVVQNFNLGESVTIIPGALNFTYVLNRGAAWSICSGENCRWILPWLSVIVSIGIASYGLLFRIEDRWERAGWGFILAGALGNGIDRVKAGEVVDFIQAFPITRFPVFNLADIWINVGIICLLIAILLTPKHEPKRP
ncbi:lipoprotein signal peptidase [Leptolyngbyaceae cyanobacterium CCMR0082]|uniref:Lipoprotein signal peptidase n=1 Tax=Adonisia turfae CCMR0082 TaxID=2304604 RepID=A0A6M0SB89_9CYAN|nr:signal peptidase II [Adonisia turfae]NEZ65737.1 lipoprotein signal peptidase [Adonisia turfae CCMR0082]